MAEIVAGTLVRLSGTAVPPLLQGLYGAVQYVGSDETMRCCVRVWNWNTECLVWLPAVCLLPLEPEQDARLRYVIAKDGDLPKWRDAIDAVHEAWGTWAHLMSTWERVNIQNDWYAKSVESILQDRQASKLDLDLARGHWGWLLATQMRLAQVAREWVEE